MLKAIASDLFEEFSLCHRESIYQKFPAVSSTRLYPCLPMHSSPRMFFGCHTFLYFFTKLAARSLNLLLELSLRLWTTIDSISDLLKVHFRSLCYLHSSLLSMLLPSLQPLNRHSVNSWWNFCPIAWNAFSLYANLDSFFGWLFFAIDGPPVHFLVLSTPLSRFLICLLSISLSLNLFFHMFLLDFSFFLASFLQEDLEASFLLCPHCL